MKTPRSLALLLTAALALPACVMTTEARRPWGGPGAGAEWARYGRVESIQEVVRRQEGNPAGGAVLGALVGGLFGNAISGSGAGTVVGAAGGAMVGAAASSQATAEQRRFEVYVRFEDGGVERFIYAGPPPYRVGDAVTLTPRGLIAG